MKKLLFVLSFAVSSCSTPKPATPQILNAISDRCDAPRTIWRMITPDKVFYFLPENLDSAKRQCLSSEMKRADLTVEFKEMPADISVEVQ